MKATKTQPKTTKTRSERNGVDLNVLQETIDAIRDDPEMGRCHFRATNTWIDGTRNRTRIPGFYGAKQEIAHDPEFRLNADEPALLAGTDNNPNPVEHMLNSLAGCVTTSMVARATNRGIEIESLESSLGCRCDKAHWIRHRPPGPRLPVDPHIGTFIASCIDSTYVKSNPPAAGHVPPHGLYSDQSRRG